MLKVYARVCTLKGCSKMSNPEEAVYGKKTSSPEEYLMKMSLYERKVAMAFFMMFPLSALVALAVALPFSGQHENNTFHRSVSLLKESGFSDVEKVDVSKSSGFRNYNARYGECRMQAILSTESNNPKLIVTDGNEVVEGLVSEGSSFESEINETFSYCEPK